MTVISFEKHLPRLFLEQLERHDDDQPFTLRMSAAVMMTDISGFSALALSLTREGAHGVETLQQTLDTYFGALGAVVARFGGDISTFAGDAVIAVWPAQVDAASAADLAVHCALAIQREASGWWQGRTLNLTQRIAVSHGELLMSKLGGAAGKWLNVFAGVPVIDAGRACDVTTPGQVLVTSSVARLLGGRLHGEPAVDGCLRVVRLDAGSVALQAGAAVLPQLGPARLAPYVLDVLVRRASAGHDEWLAEFRVVTVMFVKLDDVEFDRADAPERLQAMTHTIQHAVHRYGGVLPYVQMDDKGLNFIIAFGIPTAAYEDDAARALATGLEIQRALRMAGMRPSIGVATGVLYCGECGAEHRRQYSMIGPAINFAARLAGAAPDDLLSDEQTCKAAGDRLSFTIARNVLNKHADSAVLAFRPEWRERPPASERVSAMVGRAAELDQLVDALLAAAGGAAAGARVLVVGEPGIGKSRLLRELCSRAETAGLGVIVGEAQAMERNTPYFLWRDVLRVLLARLALPGEPWRDTVQRQLYDDPLRLPWAPLLNDILPLALLDTDLTRDMRGTARASSIQALLLHLVERAGAGGPLVLLMGDLHWIDALSGGVLLALAERLPGLSIVASSRPLESHDNAAAQDFCGHPALQRIELGALDETQSADMVGRLLGVAQVPAELSRLIHGRCDGNPFYIQQLTLALREAGQIEIVGARCNLKDNIAERVAHALPGTLRGVITSRVDRLPDEQQLLLKVASVFGRVFSGAGLAAAHPLAQQGQRIVELLAGLAGSNLVARELAAGDDGYAFSHALVLEAIYDLLPLAQRKRQHRRIADWLEEQHGALMAGFFGLLANHCLLAEEFARALNHLEGGAQTAFRHSAYREAITHIQTAQRVARERQLDADLLRQARWQGLLGDSHHELSEYGQARVHYAQALVLLGKPYAPGPLARVGGILSNLARQATARLRRPIGAPPGDEHASAALGLASHAYARLAEICYHENNPLAVLHLTLLSVTDAERGGASSELSAGYGALAIAFGQAGLSGVARHYAQRAISLAEAHPTDVNGIAYAHLLAMVHASSQCDWVVLEASGTRSEALYAGLGDGLRRASVHALLLAGAVQRGHYEQAQRLLDTMAGYLASGAPERVSGWMRDSRLNIAIARGQVARADVQDHARGAELIESLVDRLMAYGTCAAAWMRLGQPAAALAAAERGLELLLGRAPVAGAGYVFGPLGVVETLLGVPEAAAADHAARTARACAMLETYTQQVPSTRPRGFFLLACQAEQRGAPKRALALWRRAVAASVQLAMPYDQAAALQALGQRLPAGNREADQARAIFATLQVPPPALFQPRAVR